jgi:hypothetical protein
MLQGWLDNPPRTRRVRLKANKSNRRMKFYSVSEAYQEKMI